MRHLIAVAVLTISQFTALPFIAIVAANMVRQAEVQRTEPTNVTVVYKTADGRSIHLLRHGISNLRPNLVAEVSTNFISDTGRHPIPQACPHR